MAKKKANHESIIDDNSMFSSAFVSWISKQSNAVLLETTLPGPLNQKSYVFLRPERVIKATSLDNVERSLQDVDAAMNDGYFVAGFLSYEAGYAFEKILESDVTTPHPLVWFGVYEHPLIYDHKKKGFVEGKKQAAKIAAQLQEKRRSAGIQKFQPKPSIEFTDYGKAIAKIKQYILDGDTYQVNYTFKLRFPWSDIAGALYHRLRTSQRVEYSAFVSLRDFKILSISPELFFRVEGNKITLKPMKGTAPRGRTLEEDDEQRGQLRTSEKNRAENLMIVDMLRNDVGRIAKTGSVRVTRFFDIERYETVFQATSTIEALLRPRVTVHELIKSLFPSGSVTGAPKIRTMQIIRELESEPRGVYTGAVGFFAPRKKAVFNVAIRTVVIDQERRQGEMGVGSGIVHDSDTESEHQECLLKGKFLTEYAGDFELLETMRWDPQRGFSLLQEHRKRIQRSAEYFGFIFSQKAFVSYLRKYERILQKASKKKYSFRVRVTLARSGQLQAEHFRIEPTAGLQHLKISERRTNSQDRFLFHKTTHRTLYDEELERVVLKGYFDLIFLNEVGQLTEGARTNLLVKKGDRLLTPPISCGLLAGTYRGYLLRSKKYHVEEKILTPEDLKTAEEVYVCNAVRGLVKVQVDGF